jgi:hypothetical protein
MRYSNIAKEVIVLRPSDTAVLARDAPSLSDIVAGGIATGFRGKSERASKCAYVILTPGSSGGAALHYIAQIQRVSKNDRLKNRAGKADFPAFNVLFLNPKQIPSTFLDRIPWSSNNVRFIEERELRPEIDQYLKP